jgi:hypothetical protein
MRLVEHFEQKFSVESALNDAKTAIDELTLDENIVIQQLLLLLYRFKRKSKLLGI